MLSRLSIVWLYVCSIWNLLQSCPSILLSRCCSWCLSWLCYLTQVLMSWILLLLLLPPSHFRPPDHDLAPIPDLETDPIDSTMNVVLVKSWKSCSSSLFLPSLDYCFLLYSVRVNASFTDPDIGKKEEEEKITQLERKSDCYWSLRMTIISIVMSSSDKKSKRIWRGRWQWTSGDIQKSHLQEKRMRRMDKERESKLFLNSPTLSWYKSHLLLFGAPFSFFSPLGHCLSTPFYVLNTRLLSAPCPGEEEMAFEIYQHQERKRRGEFREKWTDRSVE